MRRVLKGRPFNPGDKKPADNEERIEDIKFTIFKFNNRARPTDTSRILIITCFSEFGCESIGLMYCIPRLLRKYPGTYVIAVGWYGREYLYRHLVDEYWEMKEEHQWLREYVQAFHHTSKNITKIEKVLGEYGRVLPGVYMGHICLGNTCMNCEHFWGDSRYVDKCEKCGSTNVERSLFGDIARHKKTAVKIPPPSKQKIKEAEQYLKPNAVGIFGRGRKCYGRNLQPEFYIGLIRQLELMGYNPIWLGEKQSTQPCPVDHIVDFSRMPESRDLELTLAILSQCKFTVQFWTASTRLAAMVGVPYILFESPDQIAGQGQEGLRMELTTDHNKKKLVLAHFLRVFEDNESGLALVRQAIDEINQDNWNNIIGLVEDSSLVGHMVDNKNLWGLNDR
jgi:hypothetical protein